MCTVYTSLLPRLDMLKSLGLVWIPGVIAGMMVSGASPVYAGLYQFVIVTSLTAHGHHRHGHHFAHALAHVFFDGATDTAFR
jgi:ABC-type iron transport system FetAB permease component